jgi:thioredoxin 1
MEINDSVQLKSVIELKPALLIYFYNDNCSPCQVLRPKIVSLLEKQFPLMELVFVNASGNNEITALYGIFGAPAILVCFDGKEVIREGKFVSIQELEKKISRYYSLFYN